MVLVLLLLLLAQLAILGLLWLRLRLILVRLLLVRLAGYCCCCYCCRAEQLDVVQIVQFGHLRVVAVGEDRRHKVGQKAPSLVQHLAEKVL